MRLCGGDPNQKRGRAFAVAIEGNVETPLIPTGVVDELHVSFGMDLFHSRVQGKEFYDKLHHVKKQKLESVVQKAETGRYN